MYIDFTFILINHYIPIRFYIQILACLLACIEYAPEMHNWKSA